MTVGLVHEERVAVLEQLAILAGCTSKCILRPGLLPDVCAASATRPTLFIGDAKATEGPRDTASHTRFRRYLRAAVRLRERGASVRMAICCAPHEAHAWAGELRRLARSEGVAVVRDGVIDLGGRCYVSWIDLGRGPVIMPSGEMQSPN